MSIFKVKDDTEIYYKDWGNGQPIVFHHGWPLSADDWDAQMMFFLSRGYRVIAHDRRGHGRSSQTATGNEMDTYAADVAQLAAHLDLRNAIINRDLLAFIKGEPITGTTQRERETV